MTSLSVREDLPIADYGMIGDGRTAALVGRDGSIDWLCYERLDGPAAFCRLLDSRRGGYLEVSPTTPHRITRSYVELTNVLDTRFHTSSGEVRMTDCMPLNEGKSAILRRIEGIGGEVELRVCFRPTFDFGRSATRFRVAGKNCTAHGASHCLTLTSPSQFDLGVGGATSIFRVKAGESKWVTLNHGEQAFSGAPEQALQATLIEWRRWSSEGRYDGEYEAQVRRSALLLKLLIHSETGGAVAAPTTSLPEEPGGVRNWDYRFVWLRDASWLVSALIRLGYHDESMAFIDWVERTCSGPNAMAVFYALDGGAPAEETHLDQLRGYRGSQPVRVGNAAAGQAQHDVYGEVASAIHLCWSGMPSMRPLKPKLWRLVEKLANLAAEVWTTPDHGLWEVRTEPRHFVMSKVLCWVALDRAISIAEADGLHGPLDHWRRQRAMIAAAIFEQGVDEESGTFQRAYAEREVDASLLLLPRYKLLAADDPRFVRTVERIRSELGSGGFLRRYIGRDGLPGSEGAFTACSFWLADALARRGCVDEAREVLDTALSHANDLGLFSEEIDVNTGALLGNFPQAFTHLAFIRAATTIADVGRGNSQ